MKRMPDELRRRVKDFFPLWERLGLENAPALPRRDTRHQYYDKLRHYPEGTNGLERERSTTIRFAPSGYNLEWELSFRSSRSPYPGDWSLNQERLVCV